jgi:AraC-like DNA-binding protein
MLASYTSLRRGLMGHADDDSSQPRVARSSHTPGLELVHFPELSRPCRWIPESFTGFVVSPWIRGDVDVIARGGRAPCQPGALTIGDPGEPYVLVTRTAMRGEFRVLRLDNDVRDAYLADLGVDYGAGTFPVRPQRDPGLVGAFSRLFRAMDDGEKLETEEHLFAFLAALVQRGETALPESRTHSKAVRRARDLLHARFGETVSLDELAKAAGAERFALLRAFSKELGLTPHAYQVQLRTARACRLIKQGWSLARVALEVGYSEQSALARQFRQVVGVTPGAYARATR